MYRIGRSLGFKDCIFCTLYSYNLNFLHNTLCTVDRNIFSWREANLRGLDGLLWKVILIVSVIRDRLGHRFSWAFLFQHWTRLKKYFHLCLFRYYIWWILPISCLISSLFSEVLLVISFLPVILKYWVLSKADTIFSSITQTSLLDANGSYKIHETVFIYHILLIFSERSFVDTPYSDRDKLKTNKSSYLS